MCIGYSRQCGDVEHEGILWIKPSAQHSQSAAVGNLWFCSLDVGGPDHYIFIMKRKGVFDEIQESLSKEIKNMLTICRACSSTTRICKKKKGQKMVAITRGNNGLKTHLRAINLCVIALKYHSIRLWEENIRPMISQLSQRLALRMLEK